VSCGLPDDLSGGRAWPGERDTPAIAAGVDEEQVARLRDGFRGGNASERIRRRSAPTAGPGNDMESSRGDERWNRPGRDGHSLHRGTPVRVGQRQFDLVRCRGTEEQ